MNVIADNEIVVPVDLTDTDAAEEAGLYPRFGWSNHNEIVIVG